MNGVDNVEAGANRRENGVEVAEAEFLLPGANQAHHLNENGGNAEGEHGGKGYAEISVDGVFAGDEGIVDDEERQHNAVADDDFLQQKEVWRSVHLVD